MKKVLFLLLIVCGVCLSKDLNAKAASDTAKTGLRYELLGAYNYHKEHSYGHFGGVTREDTRKFVCLSIQNECPWPNASKKHGLNYGGILGYYQTQFYYRGVEYAKWVGSNLRADYLKIDTFGFNSIMLLPKVGYSFTPRIHKKRGKFLTLAVDLGYQISIPLQAYASTFLDSSTFQTTMPTSTLVDHTVKKQEFDFHRIPKSHLYTRFSISNTLIRKANYQMGYRLGYSKHFFAITKRSAPLDWSYSPLQMQGFELGIFFKPGK